MKKIKKMFLTGILCLFLVPFALADGDPTGGDFPGGNRSPEPPPPPPSIVEVIINLITGG